MKPSKFVQAGRYLAAFVVLFLTLFPILWIIATAFKGPSEITKIPPSLFVSNPTLENFREVFEADFHKPILNSLIIAFASTFLAMVLSAPAAYAFARHPFPGSRALLTSVLIVRMVPGIALIIPFFRMLDSLHLLNTHIALVITYLSFQIPFAIWLLESFFRSLPVELEEAALVDGCTLPRAFVKIILPLASVGLATAAIFLFIASWNEFMFAVTLTRTMDARTGPAAISEAVTSYEVFWGRMTGSATIYILPALLLNLFFQRFIVRGVTMGAIKG